MHSANGLTKANETPCILPCAFQTSNILVKPQAMTIYDCIVVGLGGHGSSTLAHLAKLDCKILGIERYQQCHELGSSHGKSRIFRQAYYEGPNCKLLGNNYHVCNILLAFL